MLWFLALERARWKIRDVDLPPKKGHRNLYITLVPLPRDKDGDAALLVPAGVFYEKGILQMQQIAIRKYAWLKNGYGRQFIREKNDE